MYPCNPLLKVKTLKKCFNLIKNSKCNRVITVGRYSYPIQKALKMNRKKELTFREKKYIFYRTQDLHNLNECFYDAAQCYWYNNSNNDLLKTIKKFNTSKKYLTKFVELKNLEFCDVDTMDDLNMLKIIYKLDPKYIFFL